MNMRYTVSTILALFVAFTFGSGQQLLEDSEQMSQFVSKSIPSLFNRQFNALGKRMKETGKEQTVYEGVHVDASGNQIPARATHQQTGQVRLEGFKGLDTVLSYDGENIYGITSRSQDESLIDLFISDTPEGMFQAVQNGAAVRFLGDGFGPDPEKEPNYKGPRFDIYEVTVPIIGSKENKLQRKKYFFDSQTGLLHSTRYTDQSVTPHVKIKTQFSYWGNIDGSAYAAQIERYENGKRTFSFIAEKIEGKASESMESFTR